MEKQTKVKQRQTAIDFFGDRLFSAIDFFGDQLFSAIDFFGDQLFRRLIFFVSIQLLASKLNSNITNTLNYVANENVFHCQRHAKRYQCYHRVDDKIGRFNEIGHFNEIGCFDEIG